MRQRLRSGESLLWRVLAVGEILLYAGVLLALLHALASGTVMRLAAVVGATLVIGLVLSALLGSDDT